jgi:cytochrome P450
LLVQNIRTQIGNEEQMSIPLIRWLKAVLLDAAATALFGYNFNYLEKEINEGIDAMNFVLQEVFDPLRVAFPLINDIPYLNSNRKLEYAMQKLDELVENMIKRVKEQDLHSPRRTVLELLVHGEESRHLSVDELRNNIIAVQISYTRFSPTLAFG